MKVCPDCKSTFDDDVEVCPNDDVELVDAPDSLPENPALLPVVEVSPSERTSMIDLEAIEAKRKPKEPDPEAEGFDAEKTPPPTGDEPADPEATGTIALKDLKKRRRGRPQAAELDDAGGDEPPREEATGTRREGRQSRREASALAPVERTAREPTRAGTQAGRRERTERTERPSRAAPSALSDKTAVLPAPRRRGISPGLAAALALLLVVGIGAAVYFVARASAVLTVTTVPPGATVLLDGKPIGQAPLQKRVAVGNHTLELVLEGHEPFKEVVSVPTGGLPFLQPLREKPPPPPPPPTPQQIADEIAQSAERLIAAGDYEGAFAKVKELVKALPDDPRSDALFEKLDRARSEAEARAEKERSAKDRGRSLAAKKAEARVAYQEGERLYAEDKLDDAKARLREAVRLDSRYADPHRALARIYNRENATDRVRYHLERYLALGGTDPDFKVREWLKQNPPR